MLFSEIFTHTTVGLIEKGYYSQEKCWFVTGICLIWKLMEYKNDQMKIVQMHP